MALGSNTASTTTTTIASNEMPFQDSSNSKVFTKPASLCSLNEDRQINSSRMMLRAIMYCSRIAYYMGDKKLEPLYQ